MVMDAIGAATSLASWFLVRFPPRFGARSPVGLALLRQLAPRRNHREKMETEISKKNFDPQQQTTGRIIAEVQF